VGARICSAAGRIRPRYRAIRVRAVVGLDRGGDPEDPKVDGELKAAVSLIRGRAAIEPAKLADEAVDLRGLAVAASRRRST